MDEKQPKHRCFAVETERGPVVIHGDPNMAPEMLKALKQLATLAYEAVERSELGRRQSDPPAPPGDASEDG